MPTTPLPSAEAAAAAREQGRAAAITVVASRCGGEHDKEEEGRDSPMEEVDGFLAALVQKLRVEKPARRRNASRGRTRRSSATSPMPARSPLPLSPLFSPTSPPVPATPRVDLRAKLQLQKKEQVARQASWANEAAARAEAAVAWEKKAAADRAAREQREMQQAREVCRSHAKSRARVPGSVDRGRGQGKDRLSRCYPAPAPEPTVGAMCARRHLQHGQRAAPCHAAYDVARGLGVGLAVTGGPRTNPRPL